jgi:peptidoglycan/xylan/chitin deacetylase (PgdA/CDA1 family)
MTNNLWSANSPQDFWLCTPNPSVEIWNDAIKKAVSILNLPVSINNIDTILENTLGEAQFGPNRYQLGLFRRLYYIFKPIIPHALAQIIRRLYNKNKPDIFSLGWPIEPRFAMFQWEVLRQVLLIVGKNEVAFRYFWPDKKGFSFVLTHDVETADGQRRVAVLADMEEALGFRSIFNFVAERYKLDQGLIRDLRQRGFEIGIHGLKHDGKLFDTYNRFAQHAKRINNYLGDYKSYGFRSPLTHRNPQWMQILDMKYDMSFFDTDPYEPMPGGVMSIWPFSVGHFVELPYTLPQDHTLYCVMKETTPRIWLEKVDFIEKYHGMALVIVHPDYSSDGMLNRIYRDFLHEMKDRGGYWHALPNEIASWWINRDIGEHNAIELAKAVLVDNSISISVGGVDDS